MPRSSPVVRVLALVAMAAVAVHELRVWLGFDGADAELMRGEHAYLSLGLSLTAALAVAGLASFARALVHARRSAVRTMSAPPRFALAWAATSAVLVAIYCGQELLEGVLDEGHPGGLGGIVGHAGWSALVLAVALGAVIAWLLRGAHAVLARAARRGAGRRAIGVAGAPRSPRLEDRRPGAAVLALHLAGRAPPLTPS